MVFMLKSFVMQNRDFLPRLSTVLGMGLLTCLMAGLAVYATFFHHPRLTRKSHVVISPALKNWTDAAILADTMGYVQWASEYLLTEGAEVGRKLTEVELGLRDNARALYAVEGSVVEMAREMEELRQVSAAAAADSGWPCLFRDTFYERQELEDRFSLLRQRLLLSRERVAELKSAEIRLLERRKDLELRLFKVQLLRDTAMSRLQEFKQNGCSGDVDDLRRKMELLLDGKPVSAQ